MDRGIVFRKDQAMFAGIVLTTLTPFEYCVIGGILLAVAGAAFIIWMMSADDHPPGIVGPPAESKAKTPAVSITRRGLLTDCTAIPLAPSQQTTLIRLHRDYCQTREHLDVKIVAFLERVYELQNPVRVIEVDVLFAQRHALKQFAAKHNLSWLDYALRRLEQPPVPPVPSIREQAS